MLISSSLSPSLHSFHRSFFLLFCQAHLPAPPHPLSFTLYTPACHFLVPSASLPLSSGWRKFGKEGEKHPCFFASIITPSPTLFSLSLLSTTGLFSFLPCLPTSFLSSFPLPRLCLPPFPHYFSKSMCSIFTFTPQYTTPFFPAPSPTLF